MTPAATLAVAWALVGPVTATPHAAVSLTTEQRLVYVMAVECRRGIGWLYLSDRHQDGAYRDAFYALGAKDHASVIAATLCKSFTTTGYQPIFQGASQ
jgi:hypothetical protein